MFVFLSSKAIGKKNNPITRDVSYKRRCDGIALKPTKMTFDL